MKVETEQTRENHSENKSGGKESSLKEGTKIKVAKDPAKTEQAQVKTDSSQNGIKSGTIAEALQNQANSQNSGKNIATQTSASGTKAVAGSLSDVVNQAGTAEGKTASVEAKIKADHILSGGKNIEKNVLEQVVQKARLLVKGGGVSRMTLRLDPPHLGKIDMRIVVEDHSVKAIMMAENRDIKALIEQNIGTLKNSLNLSGLQVDEINVTTAGDQGGFMFRNENRAGENPNGGGNTGHLSAGVREAHDEAEQIAQMAPAVRNQNGNLDLVA
jgi:flagellar hook-length control protein FliK